MNNKLEQKRTYLDKHIFYGLTNLNNGFDALLIKYFSAKDFQIVLDRVKKSKLGIIGIEPWKDGKFYDVATYETVTDDPSDSTWYMKAFEDFKKADKYLLYAATYHIPDDLLSVKK